MIIKKRTKDLQMITKMILIINKVKIKSRENLMNNNTNQGREVVVIAELTTTIHRKTILPLITLHLFINYQNKIKSEYHNT